ncbi:MAG: hypothetical protein Q7J85_13570 [Bacillota bacterium]|nr:hypothetical protein [Bacillota bacterium]
MGHPDRKKLREKKKKIKQENLKRRSYLGVLDLTPYNAVKKLKGKKDSIVYK